MRISDWSSDVCSSDLPAPWNVPPGQSSTVCRLQLSSSSLRSVTEALSEFDRKVFLMTMPARPPALSILMKCCRRSEEHTSELQSLMRISYAVFCLKKKIKKKHRYRQDENET